MMGISDITGPMTPFEATQAGQKLLFVECTHTYHNAVQSGIQRVVRNILRHAGEVAAERGYVMVPVVFEAGQFRAADLSRVLNDKLRPLETGSRLERMQASFRAWRALGGRQKVLAAGLPVYRGLRRAVATVLPFEPVHRFLYAHSRSFGLGWCLALPVWTLRDVKRRFSKPVAVVIVPAAPGDGFGFSMDAMGEHAGNVLLLLDSSWQLDLWSAVVRFQAKGGTTWSVIYDLIPITHPETGVSLINNDYYLWMRGQLKVSRRFAAISRTVAAQLDGYLTDLTRNEMPPMPWTVKSFYLGSELDFVDPDLSPRPEIRAMFEGGAHVFIVVGSIEPRKNHSFILDAFDLYWKQGGTARLVIIGRHGWKNDVVLARMRRHAMAGKRLFVCRDMGDSELNFAYLNASALIIASEAEGFGLPIVEAFQRGLPVLCSDIAVFREIADGKAAFFSLSGPSCLTEAVVAFCAERDVTHRRERHPQPWLTWRDSTAALLGVVLEPCVQRNDGIDSAGTNSD